MPQRRVMLLLALTLGACASLTKHRDYFPAELPVSAVVPNIPNTIQDTADECGPAAASMALHAAGKQVNSAELRALLLTPARQGTLQADLLGAARRFNTNPMIIRGIKALLQELAAGHPVIVLENRRSKLWPQWHYALVVGYDASRQQITEHDGSAAPNDIALETFLARWQGAQEWGVTFLNPHETAPSQDEDAHIAAAIALEQAGRPAVARDAFAALVKRWPRSAAGLMGLGNMASAVGNNAAAVHAFTAGVHAHPNNASLWHNLAIARSRVGDFHGAGAAAERAVTLARGARRQAFAKSLAELLPQAH